MKIQLQLSAQEVRVAIQNYVTLTKPDLAKGRVFKCVLCASSGDNPVAIVELDEQPPSSSGYKD